MSEPRARESAGGIAPPHQAAPDQALKHANVWERLEKRVPPAHWTHPGDSFHVHYLI